MQYKIYLAQNKHTGKVYIGQTKQTVDKRWKRHVSESKAGSKLYFHRAIFKYGSDAFSWYVIDEVATRAEADDREIFYIELFQSTDEDFGYNIKGGGNVPFLPESVLERIGEKMKAHWANPEFQEKMSVALAGSTKGDKNANFGKFGTDHPRGGTRNTPEHNQILREYAIKLWSDPEQREARSIALRGRIIPEDAKKRMSESAKKAWDEGRHSRKWSEETLKKRSESLKKFYAEHPRKPPTEETRKKQRESVLKTIARKKAEAERLSEELLEVS